MLPSSHVPGGMVMDEIDTCINRSNQSRALKVWNNLVPRVVSEPLLNSAGNEVGSGIQSKFLDAALQKKCQTPTSYPG